MYDKRQEGLHDARNVDERATEIGEILATYIESIESIGAVGSQLKAVILCLGKFLAGLILVEAVTASCNAG